VLEALEEQVVLMRLLGESGDQESLTVRIGSENEVRGLQSTSVVATGYGSGDRALPSWVCSARHEWTTRRR
jgi:heat-inducible transcriptional repressor